MSDKASGSRTAKAARATKKPKRSAGRRMGNRVEKTDVAPSSLRWSAVPLPLEASANAGQSDADFFQGFSYEDDDFMGLTEVEGVEVLHGKDGIMRFVVGAGKDAKAKGKRKASEESKRHSTAELAPAAAEDGADRLSELASNAQNEAELPPTDFASMEQDEVAIEGQQEHVEDDLDADFSLLADHPVEAVEMPKWSSRILANKLPEWGQLKVPLHPLICEALFQSSFKSPTEIQAATLPILLSDRNACRDLVGIAPTGSGKTLSFGLPMLQWIATHPYEDRQMRLLGGVEDTELGSRLTGLVLTPTRELAMQVASHLSKVVLTSSDEGKRWASIASVTGGMSEQKQRRILQGYRGRGVDIIVATPGRLWDLCKSDDELARRIKTTRFLVVDEADRMIETGHFAEMENIFALLQRFEDGQEPGHHTARVRGGAHDMQTFIFSATLSKDLQHNLKRANRRKRKLGQTSTLDELLQAIDFRDDDPEVIDVSTPTRVANTVVESKAECLAKDKDLYLYYFLLRYPGRTLVFVNAIDGIRRLQPLLQNLQIDVQPLHSQLQQKQRLKSMDRFRASRQPAIGGSAVLLATDVAARGLDITAVDHVVHFQIPRTADTYVHRCGRTGRAGKSGVSLALIDPSEKRLWRDLCRSLKRADDVPPMPVEYSFFTALKQRIELAREIDQSIHTQKKASHDDAWLRKLAQDVEMDLSGDEGGHDDEEDGRTARKGGKSARQVKSKDKNVAALRAQLNELIKTPLRARGISSKYITSGSRDFLETLLNNQQHEKIIGVERSSVQADLKSKRKAQTAPTSDGQKRKRT